MLGSNGRSFHFSPSTSKSVNDSHENEIYWRIIIADRLIAVNLFIFVLFFLIDFFFLWLKSINSYPRSTPPTRKTELAQKLREAVNNVKILHSDDRLSDATLMNSNVIWWMINTGNHALHSFSLSLFTQNLSQATIMCSITEALGDVFIRSMHCTFQWPLFHNGKSKIQFVNMNCKLSCISIRIFLYQ